MSLGTDEKVGDVMVWASARIGGLPEAKSLIDVMVASGEVSISRLFLLSQHVTATSRMLHAG